jgi:cell division protease FtsH
MEKATELARSMITQYGMSKKFGLMTLETVENRYLEGRRVLNCSDQTATEIDNEVRELLKECYNKQKSLFSQIKMHWIG